MSAELRRFIDVSYRKIVHPYITRGEAGNDREIAHERALKLAEIIQGNTAAMRLLSRFFTFRDPILQTRIGNKFAPNPFGIAAGFDKNDRIERLLGEGLGFGIVTVGSITKISYDGNPRPRIFDLPTNEGLINRMGFPGDGSDKAEVRLKTSEDSRNYFLVVNIAASKTSFERGTAIEDYGLVYEQLLPYGDATETNGSSPNTKGVTGLQEPEVFKDLASHLAEIRKNSPYKNKPLIYKFSPDLDPEKLEKDLQIAIDNGADGVTLTNTSTDLLIRNSLKPEKYSNEAGGISGSPLNSRSLEITHRAYQYVGESIFIIRAGGISGTASDIWDALTYGGATIAEAYTSFVRPTTSTPNFTINALKDFAEAMRLVGMESMDDFRQYRGKRVPYPLVKK